MRASLDTLIEALPPALRAFIEGALPRIQADPQVVGLARSGSWKREATDAWSDLDLVVIDREPVDGPTRLRRAQAYGSWLGGVLGHHVGEPRLVIGLYGPPVAHVDLVFVPAEALSALPYAIDLIWQQAPIDGLPTPRAASPFDAQWGEDRRWLWLHYLVAKIGRGEYLEARASLEGFRERVLGRLIKHVEGMKSFGYRHFEARGLGELLRPTIAEADREALIDAIVATWRLYDDYLGRLAVPPTPNPAAAAAMSAWFEAVTGRRLLG